jgi:hypothetical protein
MRPDLTRRPTGFPRVVLRFALLALAVSLIGGPAPLEAQQVALTPEWQVAFALEALPPEFREDARVFLLEGEQRLDLRLLRDGDGAFICLLTVDLDSERAHSACYHDSLEPFMARGRELRRQGHAEHAVEMRNREVEEGILPMPDLPAALYQRTATTGGWDPTTGEVTRAGSLFVIYVPWATAESTGLSTRPTRGAPWLMDPGTPRAHIMFQPDMAPGGG